MAPPQTESDDTGPEDEKIVTLARASRARTGAPEGAAVRDLDGRTYAAASVDLPHLSVSALGLAVAMAVSSGSQGLEAAAVSTDALAVTGADLDVVRDLAGAEVHVLVVDRAGVVGSVQTT